MTNPMHNHLSVALFDNAQEASAGGFDYADRNARGESIKPIEVEQVVVVKNGTEGGRPTVDFVLKDETGQRYVFMVTGRLLKSIPC